MSSVRESSEPSLVCGALEVMEETGHSAREGQKSGGMQGFSSVVMHNTAFMC